MDRKESKPVDPKGNQSWIFIGGTEAEAEAPILWPPDVKNWLIGKDPEAGKDGRQEEKGMTGDEMVGWHHWLNGHEFEQALGNGDGQGSLACCSPWGCKESDTTELNWVWSLRSGCRHDQIMVKVPFWLQMDIFSLYPHMAEKTREQSGVSLLRSFNPLMRASPYDLIISQRPPPFGAISTHEYWRYMYEFEGIWEKHKHLTLNCMIKLCHNLSFHYFFIR